MKISPGSHKSESVMRLGHWYSRILKLIEIDTSDTFKYVRKQNMIERL